MEFLKNLGVGLLLTPLLLALIIGLGVMGGFLLEWARATFETDTLVNAVLIVGGVGLLGLIYGLGVDFRKDAR